MNIDHTRSMVRAALVGRARRRRRSRPIRSSGSRSRLTVPGRPGRGPPAARDVGRWRGLRPPGERPRPDVRRELRRLRGRRARGGPGRRPARRRRRAATRAGRPRRGLTERPGRQDRGLATRTSGRARADSRRRVGASRRPPDEGQRAEDEDDGPRTIATAKIKADSMVGLRFEATDQRQDAAGPSSAGRGRRRRAGDRGDDRERPSGRACTAMTTGALAKRKTSRSAAVMRGSTGVDRAVDVCA